jgi:hypothetical protein
MFASAGQSDTRHPRQGGLRRPAAGETHRRPGLVDDACALSLNLGKASANLRISIAAAPAGLTPDLSPVRVFEARGLGLSDA